MRVMLLESDAKTEVQVSLLWIILNPRAQCPCKLKMPK